MDSASSIIRIVRVRPDYTSSSYGLDTAKCYYMYLSINKFVFRRPFAVTVCLNGEGIRIAENMKRGETCMHKAEASRNRDNVNSSQMWLS